MFTAYIGIGSNQRFGLLAPDLVAAAAFEELGTAGRVTGRSSLYETQPVGPVPQPAFVNAVAELKTSLEPEELLRALIDIERRYGRDRETGVAKGPRTLDLDLLLMMTEEDVGMVVGTVTLTLPHPELAHRRFVLAPLTEIAPGLRHPVLDNTMTELLAALLDEGPNATAAVRRVDRSA